VDEVSFAARVAAAMFERDRAATHTGIVLEEVRFGYARCRFTVTEAMLNGHDVCHGGFVFMLADTAFAYACNSRNDAHVALACSISFSAAARRDEVLTAVAEERTRSNRTGTYDVTVYGPTGDTVALFRGTSYRLGSQQVMRS
jgi:acyl-CoA thioesterase